VADRTVLYGCQQRDRKAIARRLARDGHRRVVHFRADSGGRHGYTHTIRKRGADGRLLNFDSQPTECREQWNGNGGARVVIGRRVNAGIARENAFRPWKTPTEDSVVNTNWRAFTTPATGVMPIVSARAGPLVTPSSGGEHRQSRPGETIARPRQASSAQPKRSREWRTADHRETASRPGTSKQMSRASAGETVRNMIPATRSAGSKRSPVTVAF